MTQHSQPLGPNKCHSSWPLSGPGSNGLSDMMSLTHSTTQCLQPITTPIRQQVYLLLCVWSFCNWQVAVRTEVHPAILPAGFRGQRCLGKAREHHAVVNPRIFLASCTEAIPLGRVAEHIVNSTKPLVADHTGFFHHTIEERVRLPTSE